MALKVYSAVYSADEPDTDEKDGVQCRHSVVVLSSTAVDGGACGFKCICLVAKRSSPRERLLKGHHY